MTVQNPELKDGDKAELEDGKETELENKGLDGDDAELNNTQTPPKEEQVKKSAKGEINSAQAKIDAGELTKEDLPQWMQNDLRDKEEESSKESERAIIKAELKDEQEFETLQKSLPEDLDEEKADRINEIVESEIKNGRKSAEALKYAMYQEGIPLTKEKSREQKMAEVHRFPRITPRKTKPKSSESEDYYNSTLPDEYKK